MSNEKQYIGTGRQKAGSEYVMLNLRLEDILQAEHYEHQGRIYIKAVLARMRKPTGAMTHSIYVVPQVDQEELRNGAVADQQELEVLRQD